MNKDALHHLLQEFKKGTINEEQITNTLAAEAFEDLDHTKLDLHRELRNGYPEVIYGEGKTVEQITDIIHKMMEHKLNILATRIDKTKGDQLKQKFPMGEYQELGRCFSYIKDKEKVDAESSILIITAGTSDLPVAVEAKTTCTAFGHSAKIISDVGVAGIHRLFAQLETIRQAKVVIVIAGMEGALASVVGGLIDAPIIAVPTSIGYGANLGGITALLGMLSSCANGITVTNIDNGYGAAYAACKIMDCK